MQERSQMSLLTLILMLAVVAVVIYCIKLAFAGDWKNLIITAVILVLVLWVLGGFGLSIPNLPTMK